MNSSILKFASLFAALLTCNEALAWSHASSYGHSSGGGGSWSHSGRDGTASGGDGSWSGSSTRGGSASGGGGSWNGSGYRGGSASGGSGSWSGRDENGGTASGDEGSWHGTGAQGGTASGGQGAWHAQGEYGASAAGYHGNGYATTAYHPASYGTSYYHPPTAVYASSGCYNCGYHEGVNPAGAAAVGIVAGATIAGYSVGMSASAPPSMPMGTTFVSLPSGCGMRTVNRGTYYQCGSSWVRPAYGANGVFYTVVPMP